MEDQAWILRKVLTQLGRQEAPGEGVLSGVAEEFARLKSQSVKYRTDKTYPTTTAERPDNIKKNRYKDIVPFDHSRVKLSLTTSKHDRDYINASFIQGASGSRAYIATQGPLPHTLLDFLRMIWEYNIKVVVMACREFEMGKKKCEHYWQRKEGQPFVCQPFTVFCDSEENRGDYLTRTLRVTYHNSSRTLKQLHYVTWPDHGIPNSIPPILEMLDEMRTHQGDGDVPICIHCSAGCGRTGALCVIDYTWNLLENRMITPDFNIYNLVQNMRTQRPSLVQTKEQYELVYRTIRLLFERFLQSLDEHANGNETEQLTEVWSTITPDPGDQPLDQIDQELDLLAEFQHLLEAERLVLEQHCPPSPVASGNLQPYTLPEVLVTRHDLQERPRTSPTATVEPNSQSGSAGEERLEHSDSMPSLNPPSSPAVAAAICPMVEDPYFNTPTSSPSSEEAQLEKCADRWTVSLTLSKPSEGPDEQTVELIPPASDAEVPPPLPQRTPESYELAEDAEPEPEPEPEPAERLTVTIPPNAAAEAIRELGGSPLSPVPPLPMRTPESFQLDLDPAPVEQRLKVTPEVNLNRIGTSSEWSGNSKPAAAESQNEMKPLQKSKSLKVKTNFRASHLIPYCPLPPPPMPPPPPPPFPAPLPQPEKSRTLPLQNRTPASFILTTEDIYEEARLSPTPPSTRIGSSCEWAGVSQPKKFLDVVMGRSKSVRAKSSKQAAEPPNLLPLPLAAVKGGSVNVNPLSVPEVSGERPEKCVKGTSRTRSLKFFRHKLKPKVAPPPLPTPPVAPPAGFSSPTSGFKLGFGNRFGKPKGPRSYPETWV